MGPRAGTIFFGPKIVRPFAEMDLFELTMVLEIMFVPNFLK